MNKKMMPWMETTVGALLLGIIGDVVYTLFIKTWLESHIQQALNIGWEILVVIFLSVILIRYKKVEDNLRLLGFENIYDQAEETILSGLQEARNSYWWFGTSAYYVLCDPKTRENHILTKPMTEFVFVTIDPECPSVVAAQARWGRQSKEETTERIRETKEWIRKLKERGINITWEGRSTTPTFRVTMVNKDKVFVSFYEEGKLGPECRQLALNAKGLLGQWFIQYVALSRLDAKQMRIEKMLTRYLFSQSPIMKTNLLEEMKKLCPDDNILDLENTINDIKPL